MADHQIMLALVDDLSKSSSDLKIVEATDLFKSNKGHKCFRFQPKSTSFVKSEEFGILSVGEDGSEFITRHHIIALSSKYSPN